MLVREVMVSPVVTTRADTTVKAALELLASRNVSALPVLDDGGAVIGMVSEVDLVASLVPVDPRAHALPVRPGGRRDLPRYVAEVMTTDVLVLRPGSDVAEAAALTRAAGVRSFPVLDDDGRLVGVLSRSDVVRVMARSDDDIARRVRTALAGLGLEGWSVEVTAGVVELRGPTGITDGQVAALVATTVPGVVEVVGG